MSAEPSRHAWTLITLERFQEYAAEGERLVKLAHDRKVHPFAAALAGVALIHGCCEAMNGDLRWWLEFLRTGMPPGLDVEGADG